MEELKVEYTFDLEDFKTIEIIEHSYFPNDNITPAEEVLNWYRKNDLTCIGVRNNKHKIIASISILPLNKKTFYDIHEDKMHEADVVANQIEEYRDSGTYFIYLSSISVDQEYRNNYKVITTLLKGCINMLELLQRRNIKIEKVMAEASTIHGEKICKKLLRMNFIRDTKYETKIYCENGEEFMEAINRIKKV